MRRRATLRVAAVLCTVSPVYIFSWPDTEENRRYMVCCTLL
ncbi:Uncharacterised protein [Alistipes sp. cv1]|nr:Uncharacterised protein [Faecalibacterium prausnitzii]